MSSSTSFLAVLEKAALDLNEALAKHTPANDEVTQSLKTAISAIVKAHGLESNSNILEDKVLNRSAASSTSDEAAKQDAGLEQKFRNYVALLASKGYFGEHAEGTAEYNSRLAKAKERFNTKYGVGTDATTPEPVRPKKIVTPAEKEEAEKLKLTGNLRLTNKEYTGAIESYTKAIQIDPSNAIYYSNRAAAHSFLNDHQNAIQDSKEAIQLDPNFAKAYSRLGTAYYNLGFFNEAVVQFTKASTLDPVNVAVKESLQKAQEKAAATPNQPALPESLKPHTPVSRTAANSVATTGNAAGAGADAAGGNANPFAGGANPFAGGANPFAGGANPFGGNNGQMPSLNNIMDAMRNPEFMNMASEMMQNPQMQQMASNLMQNPEMLGNMMNMFGNLGGGGAGGNN